jgi:hypothetical protein
MLAVLAAARYRWEDAITAAAELDAATLSRTSFMVRNNVLNLWVDALLGRNASDDAAQALALSGELRPDTFEQGSILDLSACVDLSRARAAARLRAPAAPGLYERATATVERHAAATPMEADRAFAALARAATDLGQGSAAMTAVSRQAEIRAARIAAAGAAWGGQRTVDPALTRVQ